MHDNLPLNDFKRTSIFRLITLFNEEIWWIEYIYQNKYSPRFSRTGNLWLCHQANAIFQECKEKNIPKQAIPSKQAIIIKSNTQINKNIQQKNLDKRNLQEYEKPIKKLDDLWHKIHKMNEEHDELFREVEKLKENKIKLFLSSEYNQQIATKQNRMRSLCDNAKELLHKEIGMRISHGKNLDMILHEVFERRTSLVDELKKTKPNRYPKRLDEYK